MKIIISLFIIILIFIIIGIIIIYYQIKKNNKFAINTNEQYILQTKIDILKEKLNDFKISWKTANHNKNEKIINLINNIDNFQKNLDKQENNYKYNNQIFQEQIINIIKELTKIQESSNILKKMNDNIQVLKEVFINSKQRGNLGEFILEKILTNMLGSNSKIWKKQYKTIDGKIIDAYVKTNFKEEGIAIDSKFSIDNYQKYLISEDYKIKENYLKNFRNDIRKQIDEVSKYINIKNKIASAVMFIPSEEIFAFIYSKFADDIIEYSYKKHVWITSPTTLSAILFTVDKNFKNFEFNKNLNKISKKLQIIKNDFNRWIDRWNKFKSSFDNINKNIEFLDQTHNKIINYYNNIFDISDEKTES